MPRLGGRRAEYSAEHTQAAAFQARYRRLIVYFGEATQSFWVITPAGMVEAADLDALMLVLWQLETPRAQPSAPRSFQGHPPGRARVPVPA